MDSCMRKKKKLGMFRMDYSQSLGEEYTKAKAKYKSKYLIST